jgi:glycogen phosphorylase
MNALRHDDHYMVAADFDAYFTTQRRIDQLWLSPSDWTRMCMMNIANMAWFSSDRAISEYAQDVWRVPVTMPADARK